MWIIQLENIFEAEFIECDKENYWNGSIFCKLFFLHYAKIRRYVVDFYIDGLQNDIIWLNDLLKLSLSNWE